MRPLSYLLFSLAAIGLLQAPAPGQEKKEPPAAAKKKDLLPDPLKKPFPPLAVVPVGPSFKHLDGQMLVFVVNGAGGSTTLSENLLDLNGEMYLGLRLQMVPWTRHNARFQDLVDVEAQVNAAARIACSVKAIRKDAPNAHIFFVGYSAGAHVVLVAAEMLPANSIDRVIVLAPAVTSTYDLTRVLKATRYGIDNFFSPDDDVLQTAAEKSYLADGQKGPAAGRIGFRPSSCEKKDIEAYRALRQHKWTDDLCGSGGHSAFVLRHNLKKVVVPLFFQAPVSEVGTPLVIEKKSPPIIEKKLPPAK